MKYPSLSSRSKFSFLMLPFFLLSLPAFGQTKLATTEQLAKAAEVVAVGKVTGMVSEWNETRSMIRTRVNVVVDQYIKGSGQGRLLTLYVPGGEVGAVGEAYSDMPTFRTDENVVVFAAKDQQNHYRVAAGPQGKMTVKRDEVTGRLMVSNSLSLDELKSEVRQAVQLQNGN